MNRMSRNKLSTINTNVYVSYKHGVFNNAVVNPSIYMHFMVTFYEGKGVSNQPQINHLFKSLVWWIMKETAKLCKARRYICMPKRVRLWNINQLAVPIHTVSFLSLLIRKSIHNFRNNRVALLAVKRLQSSCLYAYIMRITAPWIRSYMQAYDNGNLGNYPQKTNHLMKRVSFG